MDAFDGATVSAADREEIRTFEQHLRGPRRSTAPAASRSS
jgi:hypothetical protein